MQRKQIIALSAGAVALVILAAGASAYVVSNNVAADKPAATQTTAARESITWRESAPAPAPQQAALPECDDGNIVGHIIGGAAGGVAGSQVGSGSGQTAATIAGTMGGAYLGGEHIPTRNVTCR